MPRVLHLIHTSHAMRPFDPYFAHLYGLTSDELRHVLDPGGRAYRSETFGVPKPNEIRHFREYRTARIVLEAWAGWSVSGGPMIIAPGTFVRLKQDPSRAGILLEGEKYAAGARMVQVRLADGQVKWLPCSALEPVPSAPESLWDRFATGRFGEPDWLRHTLTRQRVTGRLSEVVYCGVLEALHPPFQGSHLVHLRDDGEGVPHSGSRLPCRNTGRAPLC